MLGRYGLLSPFVTKTLLITIWYFICVHEKLYKHTHTFDKLSAQISIHICFNLTFPCPEYYWCMPNFFLTLIISINFCNTNSLHCLVFCFARLWSVQAVRLSIQQDTNPTSQFSLGTHSKATQLKPSTVHQPSASLGSYCSYFSQTTIWGSTGF